VMDAAGSTRAALFGIMEGGAMSLLFAATYPERVAALVTFASVPRILSARDYPWGVTDEQWRTGREGIMSFYFGSRDAAAAAARGFRGSEPSDEDVLADIDYLRRAAGSPRGMETHLRAFGETDVRQVLSGIQVPTLIIH